MITKNLKQVLILLLLISSLVACSTEQKVNYVDESDNWYVNYTVKTTSESMETTNLLIEYVGDEDISNEISYSLKDLAGEIDGRDFLKNGKLEVEGHICDGCSITKVDSKGIKVTIQWNKKSETLYLKAEEK